VTPLEQHLAVRKTSYKHLYGVRFIEAIPVSKI